MDYLKKVRDFLVQYYKRIAAVLVIACVIFAVLAVIPAAKFDYGWWSWREEDLSNELRDISLDRTMAEMYGTDEEVDEYQTELVKVTALLLRHKNIKRDMQYAVCLRGIIAGICAVGAITLYVYGKKQLYSKTNVTGYTEETVAEEK